MQHLVQQVHDLVAYVEPSDVVDFLHPQVVETSRRLSGTSQVETVRQVYEFVRDDIAHSFDIDARDVVVAASDVLIQSHGICFAKANLFAALLRELGVPVGFCYQRLAYREGFSLHGLNACYLATLGRWIRLDARGNCNGISARFSTGAEYLAYTPDPAKGERDYPVIFPQPLPQVTELLRSSCSIEELKGKLQGLEVC